MSSATQTESTPAASTSHVVVLRLVVLIVAALCMVEFWYANSHSEDYRLHAPHLTPRLWNLFLSFKLASVVALISIWNWHKWGLQLLTAMAIAMLFTEFYISDSYSIGFLLYSLRIPLLLAAVWYLAQQSWKRFV